MTSLVPQAHAATEIVNKAMGSTGDPASDFGTIFASVWRAVIVLGGLALLLYLVWGGAEWVLAGGDKAKIETARNKITQGMIGMGILAATVAIATFFSQVLGLNLLNPQFFTPQ